jgi:hypothetical protein
MSEKGALRSLLTFIPLVEANPVGAEPPAVVVLVALLVAVVETLLVVVKVVEPAPTHMTY